MRARFIFLIALNCLLATSVFAQYRSTKTFSYYNDYIVTKKDTIFGKVDETTINTATVKIIPAGNKKAQKIKASKIKELKSRYIYKNIAVDGTQKLLKVLTEDSVSLYSEEKKGVNAMSDKEPEEFTMSREVPSRSNFYLKKDHQVVKLDRTNYKSTLRQFFGGDDKIIARIDDLKFEDLEFQLLNMVIAYNFKLKE